MSEGASVRVRGEIRSRVVFVILSGAIKDHNHLPGDQFQANPRRAQEAGESYMCYQSHTECTHVCIHKCVHMHVYIHTRIHV